MKLAIYNNDTIKQVALRRELAYLAFSENKLTEAQKEFEQIVPILRKIDTLRLTGALAILAQVYLKLGKIDKAFEAGSECLLLAKKMQKSWNISSASFTLAQVEMHRKNYQSAIAFARQALEFYEKSDLQDERINRINDIILEAQQKLTKK